MQPKWRKFRVQGWRITGIVIRVLDICAARLQGFASALLWRHQQKNAGDAPNRTDGGSRHQAIELVGNRVASLHGSKPKV